MKETSSKIEKYLVGNGKNGYLQRSLSLNKLIMITGEWGSGKTYFWKNRIEPRIQESDIPIITISMYGKKSLEEVKEELFIKISSYNENYIKKLSSVFSGIMSKFSLQLSFSFLKINLPSPKDEDVKEKLKKFGEELNKAIICFDDFERKSKDIDLNDLFGFINSLKEEFECRVVVIVNDEAFKEEDAKIFAKVKEKSVDKFLVYVPSISQLFEDIKKDVEGTLDKKSGEDEKLKEFYDQARWILEKIEFQNARVYKQIILNIYELYENNFFNLASSITDDILGVLRFIVLNTILFNKYHKCLSLRDYIPEEKPEEKEENKFASILIAIRDEYKKILDPPIIKDKYEKIIENTPIFYEIFPHSSILRGVRSLFPLFFPVEPQNIIPFPVFQTELRHLKDKKVELPINLELVSQNVELVYDSLYFIVKEEMLSWIDTPEKLTLSKTICEFIQSGIYIEPSVLYVYMMEKEK